MKNRCSLIALHTVMFTMSAGFYILWPLLGNQLISTRHIPVVTVTLILNSRVFVQDLLMLPAGFLCDRLGNRNVLVLSGIFRGTGFLIMAVSASIPTLFVGGLLSGIGGSLFFPASFALYADMAVGNEQLKMFTVREALNSLGSLLGPLIGTAALLLGFQWVGILAAVVFFLSSAVVWLLVKNSRREVPIKQNPIQDLRRVFTDKRFVGFSIILMVVTVFMNQQMIAIPVRINQIDASYAYVGVIYSVSSIIMVLFQIHLTRTASSVFSQYNIVGISVIFYMAGLGIMGFIDHIPAIYAGSIVYSIGTVLLFPAKNTLIARYAPEGAYGSYFGAQGFINTIGNLFLSSGLGVLYEMSDNPSMVRLPWIAILISGAALCAVIFISEKKLAPSEVESL